MSRVLAMCWKRASSVR